MPAQMTSVRDYDNYRSFLKDTLGEKVRKNPTFSMRAFARLIGLSPSHLSRTLGGQKRLSATSARSISLALNHTAEEADHFLGLIELEAAASVEQKSKVLKRLSRSGGNQAKVVSMDAFRTIGDWYHFAILALTNTRGFRADSAWIARRLGIKLLEARLAVERLLSLGLLERTKDSLIAVNDADISTTDDLTSAAIQENHRQHLALAAESLSGIEVELREFNNITMTMNLGDVPKAKKTIRAFIDKFNNEFESKPGQEVFQLNVQFYLLSKSEKGRA